MADKTVNVNIKYNVDTSQITKAQAASAAAQKATDELRKSVETYGKATVAANRQVAASTQSVASEFTGLVSTVKLFLTAGLAKEIVDISLNMSRLAGNVEAVSNAFNKQIPNATSLLGELRKATHGAVTDLELMQKTLQAKNFGLAVESLPKLLEFAAIRAQQTGVSVDYLVNSIVTGIGRKSILILDNLGISATRLKEEFNGAALASQSVADVTEAVGRIAEQELAKMGGYAENAATDVDQLSVSWTRLRENIAKFFSSGAIPKFLKDYVDSFSALAEAINRGISVSEVFQERLRQEQAQISANEFIQRTFTKSKEENIKILEEEIAQITKSLGAYAKQRDAAQNTINFFYEQIKAGQGNLYVMEEQIDLQKRFIESKKPDALLDQEILRILLAKLAALKAINKEQEKEIEDRSLVTDKVSLFDMKVIPKKGLEQKALEQQLVDVAKMLQEAADNIPPVLIRVTPYVQPYQDSEFEKAWEDNMEQVKMSALNNTESIIQSEIQRELDSYSVRISALKDFYDEQQLLAGDNKRAKDQLRLQEEREIQTLERRRADREKKAAQAGILVNTALAIIKIFAGEGTYVDKLIRAGIMAGEGATQYAVASRARYYAKGEINIKGPGSETSDSIPAMLSKGESIMTAKQTREAFGILTDVRAGKLNDRVLKQLVTNGGSQMVMDDSRIVDAIKGQPKPPDLVRSGRQIYEVYTDQQNNKRFIRSKSI